MPRLRRGLAPAAAAGRAPAALSRARRRRRPRRLGRRRGPDGHGALRSAAGQADRARGHARRGARARCIDGARPATTILGLRHNISFLLRAARARRRCASRATHTRFIEEHLAGAVGAADAARIARRRPRWRRSSRRRDAEPRRRRRASRRRRSIRGNSSARWPGNGRCRRDLHSRDGEHDVDGRRERRHGVAITSRRRVPSTRLARRTTAAVDGDRRSRGSVRGVAVAGDVVWVSDRRRGLRGSRDARRGRAARRRARSGRVHAADVGDGRPHRGEARRPRPQTATCWSRSRR